MWEKFPLFFLITYFDWHVLVFTTKLSNWGICLNHGTPSPWFQYHLTSFKSTTIKIYVPHTTSYLWHSSTYSYLYLCRLDSECNELAIEYHAHLPWKHTFPTYTPISPRFFSGCLHSIIPQRYKDALILFPNLLLVKMYTNLCALSSVERLLYLKECAPTSLTCFSPTHHHQHPCFRSQHLCFVQHGLACISYCG